MSGVAPRSFKTAKAFRAWLQAHHANVKELQLRLFKVHALHRGIGHRDALDEALCFGWIDGVVRSLDADSYTIRFTPRRRRSKWSLVNIRRARELEQAGRMHAAGLAAFRARGDVAVAPYSFESKPLPLSPAFLRRLRANKEAWDFWSSEPPGRKRITAFWVMSAKKPETRERRFVYALGRLEKRRPIGLLQPGK
jgi:uncharacterized protein YdeI (YjbR/CyaY-like superfamily)